MTDPEKETVKKVCDEILNGLYTDGAHHKQYHLEQALRLLVGEKRLNELRVEENCDWEEGIPS